MTGGTTEVDAVTALSALGRESGYQQGRRTVVGATLSDSACQEGLVGAHAALGRALNQPGCKPPKVCACYGHQQTFNSYL